VLVDVPAGERVYLCARLRSSCDVPVLVLGDATSVDAPARVDAGADDYLAHPERLHEVAARLRAQMRRSPSSATSTQVLDCAGVIMDMDRHHVEVDGREVVLPLNQFRLLELLMTHAGQIVSNRAIVEHVWGPMERVDRNTVQAHMARLRQTLGDEEVARRIRAVPGVGYTFPR
jgi:DNA-binding response OmpR family regulator